MVTRRLEPLCNIGRECDLRIHIDHCLSSHPGTSIKHSGQKYLREDLFHLMLPGDHPLFPLLRNENQGRKVEKGFRTRTWPWALTQRAWRDAATWLLLGSYSATFLRQPMPTSIGMTAPTVGWALQHQLAIDKMPTDTQPNRWKQFFI